MSTFFGQFSRISSAGSRSSAASANCLPRFDRNRAQTEAVAELRTGWQRKLMHQEDTHLHRLLAHQRSDPGIAVARVVGDDDAVVLPLCLQQGLDQAVGEQPIPPTIETD